MLYVLPLLPPLSGAGGLLSAGVWLLSVGALLALT